MTASMSARHHVVIIGSGFGGLFAAKGFKRADVDVTVISRTTHHLFQPLLYQVATGILSEGEIAPATREVLRRRKNVRVLLGEVTDIDLTARTVTSVAGTTAKVSHPSRSWSSSASSANSNADMIRPRSSSASSMDFSPGAAGSNSSCPK